VNGGLYWPERSAVDNTTRKPLLLFQLSGSFLLRHAQRTFL
jgi:hypothetical protein